MEPFRVFISSIMDPAKEDLVQERVAARRAIEHFEPITKAWAFEAEAASTKPILEFYLGEVKACDLLVVILGQRLTEPVKAECETARDYRKAILVFRKDAPSRAPEVEALLTSLDLKWDSFSEPAELQRRVQKALGLELLRRIRGDGNTVTGHGDDVARLRQFSRNGTAVEVSPLIPNISNIFSVVEVSATAVKLEKHPSNSVVELPLKRVTEVLERGNRERPLLMLDGRLQWLTFEESWRFFPETPDAWGVSKSVVEMDPRVMQLLTRANAERRNMQPCPLEQLPMWTADKQEIFYDSDGRYLQQGKSMVTIWTISRRTR